MVQNVNGFDREYLLSTMKSLIYTPSPSGYYEKIHPLIEKLAEELGLFVTYDRKRTAYIKVAGKDKSKTVCVSAHIDTLGLVVRNVSDDGKILVRNLGWINYNAIEGGTVTIHTLAGNEYTGLLTCKSHSLHAFDDTKTIERTDENMFVLLDKPVDSEKDVRALGINNGDIIFIDPRFEITQTGFIKSMFLDNKSSAAISFAVMKYLKENKLMPYYDTVFAFSLYEEVCHGAAYVPLEISEYLAVDVALIGGNHKGNEHSVSICRRDGGTFYSPEMVDKLVILAKENNIPYVEDVFFMYGSDASHSQKTSCHLKIGAIGVGTFGTHGRERTHVDGLEALEKLVLAYIMN